MTLIVQIFYLYRIFHVSGRNYWIIMPIVSLDLCHQLSQVFDNDGVYHGYLSHG
ncbi:hypothetical protein M378DRAFT_164646 [Amanita muscaria Koide BX008]|uniref:Uncharacterized protein n=1 Tax=Amanita muscaria (strain Koide BX008) TaxID=946122 RepID=A0A0C2SJD4_AMAMK|nr:hypothetical protein M378DRAFT_164646 [Amanita muscaria Koide BX008]